MRSRPSLPMVMAMFALFTSLCWSAYAGSLPDNSVKSVHIQNGAVRNFHIKTDSVINEKLADNAASSSLKFESSSVTSADIAPGQIQSSNIKDNSIEAGDVNASGLGPVGSTRLFVDSSILRLGSTYETVARATAPANGNYLVFGTADVFNRGTSDAPVRCRIFVGDEMIAGHNTGLTLNDEAVFSSDANTNDNYILQTGRSAVQGTVFKLKCLTSTPDEAAVRTARLSATRVGALKFG